jgi:tetratricopeptide (TPR) repeat protein
MLTRALAIHPDYPQAHASLAMTYNLARQYSGMSGWDAYPLAERHARRAVELAPGYAFGHSVLAFVEFHWLWQVEAGLARFELARTLDLDDASNLLWYASSLIHVLRYEDALTALTRAQELDPGNATVHNLRALSLHALGRREEAISLLEEMIRNDPGHPWHYNTLALCRLAELDYAGYLENYARVGDRIGVPRHRALAEAGLAALRRDGPQAMAQAMAALDSDYVERGEALAWDVAMDYAMVGNWQEAIPLLRASLDRHEERLIGVKYNPAFWPIRDRPEYKQILADIGLPTE